MPKQKQILERPAGIGEVTRDDKVIATVKYSLEVTQDLVSNGMGEFSLSTKDVSGQIIVEEGESNLVNGQTMILGLADGRTWPFYAARGDNLRKIFECKSSGYLG